MSKKNKKQFQLPKLKNEADEREFWSAVDLTDFFEAGDFQPVSFPNLKPTSRAISIRLPEYLLDRIKEKANEMGIPYQSLIKQSLNNIFISK